MSDGRKMPPPHRLGQQLATTMASPMMNWEHWKRDGKPNPHGLRVVMGYYLPEWQRGLVWTEAQNISLLESAWLGIPIGTFSYNVTYDLGVRDMLLIDGQQRMNAIQRYLEDAFPVFGYRWSELSPVDHRRFDNSVMFPSYRVETTDEDYLRNYYNLMNFGGTAHKPEERA